KVIILCVIRRGGRCRTGGYHRISRRTTGDDQHRPYGAGRHWLRRWMVVWVDIKARSRRPLRIGPVNHYTHREHRNAPSTRQSIVGTEPPSTRQLAPLTNEARSEQRKAITLATSSGSPRRWSSMSGRLFL